MTQNDKKFCLLHSIPQEPYIIWLSFMIHTHLQNDDIFRCFFFHFLKILISWFHRRVKGQKIVQNDKKFCLLCSISQEPCIIWLPFMVQMCKMIISPGVFFNCKILIFWVVRGLKGQEMAKMTKISVCCNLYFRNHISYDLHL